MSFGVAHVVAESRIFPCSDAVARHCHPLRPFLFGEDLLQKRKAKRLHVIRSLSPVQQEREPVSSEAPQSVQSQLELLEKLRSGRERGKEDEDKNTIGEQLAKKVAVNTDEEVAVPLGRQNPLDYDDLTISQKRNIRRQKYLDQVSKRNDVPFFAAIVMLVFLPPAIILGVAVATGYINLLP